MVMGLLTFNSKIMQKHKCVALEDLAAEFNLRTQVSNTLSSLFVMVQASWTTGLKWITSYLLLFYYRLSIMVGWGLDVYENKLHVSKPACS